MSHGEPVGFRKAIGVGAGAWIAGAILTVLATQVGIDAGVRFLADQNTVQEHLAEYLGLHVWFLSGSGVEGAFRVLTAIPGAVLLAAGFIAASSGNDENAFQDGASVAAGYLGTTVIATGFLLLGWGSGLVLAEVLLGLFVVGVAFPLVLGGLGGVLTRRVRWRP